MAKTRFKLYQAYPDKPTEEIKDVRTIFPESPVREYVDLENNTASVLLINEKAKEGVLFMPQFIPKRVKSKSISILKDSDRLRFPYSYQTPERSKALASASNPI